MPIYPGARFRPIEELRGLTRRMTPVRANLHVTASARDSMFEHVSKRGNTYFPFHIAKDGTVEQYFDTNLRGAADLDGNPDTIAIETQGAAPGVNAQQEPWTPQQVVALVALLAWLTRVHPTIPLRMATDSKPGRSSHGISWHRLGIDGNFPRRPSLLAGREQLGGGLTYTTGRGKVCPGDAKILQIPGIVRDATNPEKGTEMANPSEIATAVLSAPIPVSGSDRVTNLRTVLAWSDRNTDDTRALIRDVVAAAVPAIVNGVLRTPIPRRGPGATGETTLAAVLAYSDAHIDVLRSGVGKGNAEPVDVDGIAKQVAEQVRVQVDGVFDDFDVRLVAQRREESDAIMAEQFPA